MDSVNAPSPVPVELQHCADAFARGEHYDAVYDRTVAEGYIARNRATVAALLVIGIASVLLCVVLVVFGGGFTRLLVILGIFGFTVMLLTLPTIVNVGRRLRRVHAGDGVYARVSSEGISFGLTGLIAWGDVLAVIAFDDTERVDRTRRIPLIGWGVALSRRAGNGARGLSIALRDGSAVQARIQDERERGFIRLWGPASDPARKGDISLLLDPLLDDGAVKSFIEAVATGALLRGLPVLAPRSSAEYIKTLGRLLDPKWPAGM